jgi:hypothetical protein
MNMTRASGDPFRSLNTALRPHIAGQRVQPAASFTKRSKESLVIYHLPFIIFHLFRKPKVFKWQMINVK